MKTFLMGSTSWSQPLWSHGDFGGGGADGGEGESEQEGEFLGDDDLLDGDGTETGLEGEDEINGDSQGFLAKLWAGTEEESEEEEEEDAGDSEEARAAMRASIATAISAIQIPEDAIPEDFDPTNRKQLRELLAATNRQAVQHALTIMMNPIGAAFKQTIVRMRQEFTEGISQRFDETESRSALHAAIPIAKNREYSQVVDTILKQSMKRTKNDRPKAIIATRKALRVMGINPDGPAGGTTGGSSNRDGRPRTAAQRTNDVLDMFAPLPPRENDANKQLANRMRKK